MMKPCRIKRVRCGGFDVVLSLVWDVAIPYVELGGG